MAISQRRKPGRQARDTKAKVKSAPEARESHTTEAQPVEAKGPAGGQVDTPGLLDGFVVIEAPVGSDPEGYIQTHVEMRFDYTQARALSRLRAALDAQHARLADGRPVFTRIDAVRYLLELYAQAVKALDEE